MSTLVTLRTVDGRIIHGINYTLGATTIPSSVPALTAAMPGGPTMGAYHIHTPYGWEYIPASQIGTVLQVNGGAPT